MNRLIVATVVILAASPVTASLGVASPALKLAQATTTQPGATGTSRVREAPVGHRQPRRGDVPDTTTQNSTMDAQDKALDRKIRSICRGC